MAHIQHEIYLVLDLNANTLIKIDIMTSKQFVLDFLKKTPFIKC